MTVDQFSFSIDNLFWRLALKDDEEAFRIIFFHFYPALCVFAGRYVGNKETGEDIVQETFLKIWKNRKEIEITTSANNYLITSVRNSCADYLRSRQADESYQRITPEMENALATTDDSYALTELLHMTHSALDRLPEHIRTVFLCNRVDGETYAEIARKHHISVKTVEAYISKALKHLRIELKDFLPFMVFFF